LRAIDLYTRLEQARPKDATTMGSAAGLYQNLGALYSQTDRYAEGVAAYEKALQSHLRRAAFHPALPGMVPWGGLTHPRLGPLYLTHQEWDRARDALTAALGVLKPLADQYPREAEYRRQLAAVYGSLALVDRNQDRWESASSHTQTAVAILEPLLREQPK